MNPITIEVNGVKRIVQDAKALPTEFIDPVILKMSQIAYDSAQEGAGRHTQTGALFQSLFNRAIPDGRQVGHDPNRAPHAAFVHDGTRPHEIRPKTKRALRWAGPNGFIFAKSVQHPGYRGDPYFETAEQEVFFNFNRIVELTFREAMNGP